jgi:hypothetical protein
MVTQSRDTNPEAEKFLITLLRKRTISEKLDQVLEFSSSIIKLSKRAISRANPNLSKQEKDILFVKYHYGKELADKLRAYLEQREV